MLENYDPKNPSANRAAFRVDPPNYEWRASIALLFSLMFCAPIVAGIIAILTARTVLRAPVPITQTARIASWVSISLGTANILIWSLFILGRILGWWGHAPVEPAPTPG
jgi:hypothetical protein